MEDVKAQALHDALCKHRKSQGLGVATTYSWAATVGQPEERTDGLPANMLYSFFLKEGNYDPTQKVKDGDGRLIIRDFSHYLVSNSDSDKKKKLSKEERKEQKKADKKAAKLEVKKTAKMEEKKRLKKEAKLKTSEDEDNKKRKSDKDEDKPKKKKRKVEEEPETKSAKKSKKDKSKKRKSE